MVSIRPRDKAALEAEACTLVTEIQRIATDAKWKGNRYLIGTGKTVGLVETVVAGY